MGASRSLGAVAAFANALLFLFVLVMFLVVAPALGVTNEAIGSPESGIALTQRFYPLTFAIYAIFLLVHPTLIATIGALRDRIAPRAEALANLAYAVGVAGVAFNAFETTGPIVMNKVVASFSDSHPAAAVAAQIAVDAVSQGAHLMGYLGLAAMILICSLAALRDGGLPRWLALYGLVPGALGVATIVALDEVRPLMFVALIVWYVGVGRALSRQSPPTAPAAGAHASV
jgi:hypothetical protein